MFVSPLSFHDRRTPEQWMFRIKIYKSNEFTHYKQLPLIWIKYIIMSSHNTICLFFKLDLREILRNSQNKIFGIGRGFPKIKAIFWFKLSRPALMYKWLSSGLRSRILLLLLLPEISPTFVAGIFSGLATVPLSRIVWKF